MSRELSDLGKAAVWYCEHGFAIIPIRERGKEPVTKHGLNDWFDSPEDARELWLQNPNWNIGIVCGAPSHGLLVLDFDVDEEKEKDGFAALSAWERVNGDLPETAVAITGSGGMHYLYRTDRNNIHPSANPELGVDVRCDRSYIVAPPSVHPNGRLYAWQDHPEDVPIATANGQVYDFLDHVQRNGGQDETKKENGKFKLPEKIGEGNRGEILFKYACHLRAIGRSDEEILNSVMGVNYTRCDPPMDTAEVNKTVRSACRYERGEHTSDDAPAIGKPGSSSGGVTDSSDFPQFRKVKADGTPGAIQHNMLARGIMQFNHAKNIDGALAVWTGNHWEFGVRAIKSLCTHYADDIKETTRSEVVKYITTSEMLPSVSSESAFDGGYYVQFLNGTWDALNQQFVEPTPDKLIIGTIPIELDLDAPYGLADQFIESVSDEDRLTERVLQEIIGACMCSRQTITQAIMLVGRANGITAANGKSTYIKALKSLLGPQNTSTLDINMFEKLFYVADLIGKLANLGDDIPAGYLSGEGASTWKRAVTGETIKADVKYGDPFNFNPRAVQIFSMNVIPRIPADDDGLYRRLAFIPFRRHFEPGADGTDQNLSEKLAKTENLQRLALLGLQELPALIKRGKLTELPDMAQELEDVRMSNDPVRRWVSDNQYTDADFDGWFTSDVYSKYKDWAKETNENQLRQDSFTKRLLRICGRLAVRDTRERGQARRGNKFVIADLL